MVNKQMENEKKYSLQEAVRLYGSDEHKKTVIQDNKNLIGNSFKSFMTTLEQYFEEIEVTGRGKKREFLCSGEYSEKQTRKTGHEDRMPYYQFFEEVLLFELAYRDKKKMGAQTRLMYAKNFDFLAGKMFNDYYNHSHFKDEKKKNEEILEINKQKMKEDFLKIEIQNMDNLVGKALKKLSEEGKIKVTESIWVRELNQSEQQELIEKAKKENREPKIVITGKERRVITKKELDLATRFDDEMQDKYNIKSQLYIPLYKKHSFKYNNFFNELGIKYIYKKYNVEVLDFSSIYGKDYIYFSLIQFKEELKMYRVKKMYERMADFAHKTTEDFNIRSNTLEYLEFFDYYEYPKYIKVPQSLLEGRKKPEIDFYVYDDFEKAREEIRKHLILKGELHLIEELEHEEQAYLEQA